MALTKAQARSLIRNLLDDEARRTWSDASLDVLTQTTLDELWGELLDEMPWHGVARETIVAESNGTILLTAPTLLYRFHRVQKVTDSEGEFSYVHQRSAVIFNNEQITAPDRTFTVIGQRLYIFPLTASKSYELSYSAIPGAYTSLLDTDSIAGSWLDGFENAFIFDVAARASIKQPQAVLERYENYAAKTLDRMKGRMKRQYVGPATINDLEAPEDFGGV